MSIFPTQYSLISADALNLFIQDKYGLQHSTCKLLMHNVSDTYIIVDDTNKTKYIFKIYRNNHRKVSEINGEIELLELLHNRNAKVAYPIKDLQGSYLQSFNVAEGTRYGVMFSFAPGEVIYNLNENQLKVIGKEMAHIHNLTANLFLQHERKNYDINTTMLYPLEAIEPAFENLPDEYNYLVTTSKLVIDKLEKLNTLAFSYGYCHYDFLPKNFHFDENDNITFFDFDFAGKGLLANDIASFYVHFFLEVYNGKTTQAKANQDFRLFTDAYSRVRPLTKDELDSIPFLGYAFWIFYLGFAYTNYEDWSNIFFGERYLRERVALIKQWTTWYCKF